MSAPGSSGKAGPTPISGLHDGEQVRPAFHLGGWYLTVGDTVVGHHRARQIPVVGTVITMYGVFCVSTRDGVYPLQRIAIHKVAPPLTKV